METNKYFKAIDALVMHLLNELDKSLDRKLRIYEFVRHIQVFRNDYQIYRDHLHTLKANNNLSPDQIIIIEQKLEAVNMLLAQLQAELKILTRERNKK